MTVKELIIRLLKLPEDWNVVMVMDWTKMPEKERPSNQQWEDYLGDLAVSNKRNEVLLINENFK